MRRDVFQAIADPTRREIIGLLSSRPLNLNNVSDHFSVSRPAISKHIRILTECGLVKIQRSGRERICHANLHQLKEVADWTARYKIFWNQKLDLLATFLENESNRNKKARKK